MSDFQENGPGEPFRFVVTYRAGVSVWRETTLTKRQQILLQFLAENAGRAVTREQLLSLAYGSLDASLLDRDMDCIESELARTVSSELVMRAPDGGYSLTVEKVRISMPLRP